MYCGNCNKHLVICTCADVEERLQSLVEGGTAVSFCALQNLQAREEYKCMPEYQPKAWKAMIQEIVPDLDPSEFVEKTREEMGSVIIGVRVPQETLTDDQIKQLEERNFNVYDSSHVGMISITKAGRIVEKT